VCIYICVYIAAGSIDEAVDEGAQVGDALHLHAAARVVEHDRRAGDHVCRRGRGGVERSR